MASRLPPLSEGCLIACLFHKLDLPKQTSAPEDIACEVLAQLSKINPEASKWISKQRIQTPTPSDLEILKNITDPNRISLDLPTIDISGSMKSIGYLLEMGERGLEVACAARAGNGALERIQALLASGPIPEDDRGIAVQNAAQHGNLNVVNLLLANGPISKQRKGTAVLCATWGSNSSWEGDHLGVLKALLASGPIPEKNREDAIKYAKRIHNSSKMEAIAAAIEEHRPVHE